MSDQIQEANLFELGGGGIQITYSTTSISGQPLFSYRDATTNQQFMGGEITVTDTPIGALVSVVLEQIPDLRTIQFSVLIPTTRVIFGSAGTCIDVPAVTSTTHTTIAGPGLGPEITYSHVGLTGTAQAVIS